jgi:hypothetical protein
MRLGLIHPGAKARVADRTTGRLEAIADPSPDWAIFGEAGDAAVWLDDRGHSPVGWEIFDIDKGESRGPVGG